MTITMPADSKADLISTIQAFTDTASSRRQPLLEWQQLLGWINWALNAYPLLRPVLQSSYVKISGKSQAHTAIFINCEVIRDLQWLAQVMEGMDGICMLDAITWNHSDVDIIYCDATLQSMGFYYMSQNTGYFSELPNNTPLNTIFYYEALCVVSVLLWATELRFVPHRVLIYMDLLNTVEIFHSLKAPKGYNDLLLFATCCIMNAKTSLQVFHIDGINNVIADTLSHSLFELVLTCHPGLNIHMFQPPQNVTGTVAL